MSDVGRSDPKSYLTANDRERSCTTFSLPVVTAAIARELAGERVTAMLDVGCGYGGIAASLRAGVDADEVHGVDIDPAVIDEARGKGVRAVCADVAAEGLPYDDGTFGLVTCFGMLDYLPWYDPAVREFGRVLAPGGVIAIALPNLGSWHNRLALLLGFQPRDVEFCSIRAVGLAPFYRSATPVGHVHTPTTRAFREFMALMGFAEAALVGLRPDNNPPPAVLGAVDALLGRVPSLARRFLYVGRRSGLPASEAADGWWSGRAAPVSRGPAQ